MSQFEIQIHVFMICSKKPQDYGKRITFVFFLAPLAVESLRFIKYTAKYAFIKV